VTVATTMIDQARFDAREFYGDDPHAVFAELRRTDPVHWYERGQFWVITKYEDIREINTKPEVFSSAHGATIGDNVTLEQVGDLLDPELRGRFERGELGRHKLRYEIARMRERASIAADADVGERIFVLDPPRHTRLRKFVTKAFTPRMVKHFEDEIRRIIYGALDAIEPGEVVDLVQELSVPIPAEVIAVFLGVPPEDRSKFVRWADDQAQTYDEGNRDRERLLRESVAAMHTYVRDQLRFRRDNPGDDMLTALLNAEVEGERLPEETMVQFATTFLFAGSETTRHLISHMARLLGEQPEQRQILLDRPELIPTAIDEFLRFVSPVWNVTRTAVEPAEIRGKEIKEGDFLVIMYASGNRDEEVWGERAHELDVTRQPDPQHVGFGWGEHRCLGSNLARLEARMTLEHLLERFPSFEPAGEPVRVNSATFNAIGSLPMLMK
jgi:cytochrome P450